MPTAPRRSSPAARPVAAVLLLALVVPLPACSGKSGSPSASASASASQDKVKFAKTRFAVNAGLAAGATYQWLYKPYKEGRFRKGANGRTAALVKGALAGTFAYNRLKAAVRDAQGDPFLSKALAPLASGIESLKALPSKIRNGSASDADVNQYQNVINGVKGAGAANGANVTDKVPTTGQLTQGG